MTQEEVLWDSRLPTVWKTGKVREFAVTDQSQGSRGICRKSLGISNMEGYKSIFLYSKLLKQMFTPSPPVVIYASISFKLTLFFSKRTIVLELDAYPTLSSILNYIFWSQKPITDSLTDYHFWSLLRLVIFYRATWCLFL